MIIPAWLEPGISQRAIPLDDLGISSPAWCTSDALAILQICSDQQIRVQGADVLIQDRESQEVQHTYDNWYTKKNADVSQTIAYANERVRFYNQVHTNEETGSIPLFLLVFEQG